MKHARRCCTKRLVAVALSFESALFCLFVSSSWLCRIFFCNLKQLLFKVVSRPRHSVCPTPAPKTRWKKAKQYRINTPHIRPLLSRTSVSGCFLVDRHTQGTRPAYALEHTHSTTCSVLIFFCLFFSRLFFFSFLCAARTTTERAGVTTTRCAATFTRTARGKGCASNTTRYGTVWNRKTERYKRKKDDC